MNAVLWREDNRFTLLENGESFFPAVNRAIESARNEILLETFILADDEVGQALAAALIAAARRGVAVAVTVDGYGSDALTPEFLDGLAGAGVRVHVFDPRPRFMGMRTHVFRRMHRKLVAVDGEIAFAGGINFATDHLDSFGPQAKQDYALRIEGPMAAEIAGFMQHALSGRAWPRLPRALTPDRSGAAGLLIRDNQRHRDDIERFYRAALRAAKRDVIIANAYFFPGYRLLRDLAQTARRGVRVRLVLQGEPDMRIAQLAAGTLYDYLMQAGVEIHEYCRRPLHGKIACFDDDWSTVGSSNLDPFSLALNLEANVVARDRGLNAAMRARLERLMREDCNRVAQRRPSRWRRLWGGVLVFHLLRRFPAWAGSLPAHKPRLREVLSADSETS